MSRDDVRPGYDSCPVRNLDVGGRPAPPLVSVPGSVANPTGGAWEVSYRADRAVVPLADRHYNRQSIGADQFVPPGSCLVLRARTPENTIGAFWVTSWPIADYVQHEWAGAWINSAFRNERRDLWLSSGLITAAVAATRCKWDPPPLGMVTFIDTDKTRRKRDPGRCYRRAGFKPVGYTKGGLVALQMLPEDMPDPLEPMGAQQSLVFP
jgi:hypothetical protein